MNQIRLGDCRDVMRELIAEGVRVQMCVTSPPYWGLRSYGIGPENGELGLEATPEEYVANMVEVFRLVRELLADDGTAWVNMGDAYSSGGRGGNPTEETSGLQGGQASQRASMVKRYPRRPPQSGVINGTWQRSGTDGGARIVAPGFQPKQLLGMPWRLAFALQADGWYLRQDIIWHKPNPMPESVRDRCTKAHEYIFLLAKRERYYYDADSIKEPSGDNTHARGPGNKSHKGTSAYLEGAEEHRTKAGLVAYAERRRARYKTPDGWDTSVGQGGHGSFHKNGREKGRVRDVGVGPKARPSKGVPNGTPREKYNDSFSAAAVGLVPDRNKRSVWTVSSEPYPDAHFATYPTELIKPCILAGSRPGDIVFDPFMGSGTTAQVALELGRQYLGCELNPEYAKLAEQRTKVTVGLPLETA